MAPALRMLGVFAHPDDESFGPGATIARYARQGVEVRILTFTRGERSTVGLSPQFTPEELAREREGELRRACAILGVSALEVLGYPDSGLAGLPLGQLVEEVARRLRSFRPHCVLTFHPNGISGHTDHQTVTRAVELAFEAWCDDGPLPPPPPPARLFYWCIPQSVALAIQQRLGWAPRGVPDPECTTVVEVGPYLGVHWEAVRAHRTQATPLPEGPRLRMELLGGREFFLMARSCPPGPPPRGDLFA